MTHYGILSGLAAVLVLAGCGLSAIPSKDLSGSANDPVAAAQRDSLGLGNMALYNSTNLPALTLSGASSHLSVGGTLAVTGTSIFTGAITASGGVLGNATSATNLASGAAGQIPYQSALNTTLFSAAGALNQVLLSGGAGAPTWSNQSSLSVGTATHIASGTAGQIPYQTGPGATAFSAAGTASQVLLSGGAGAPTWSNQSSLSVGTATHIASGTAGQIPYQTGPGATAFSAAGTASQVLLSGGAGAPTWSNQSSLSVGTATHLSGGSAGVIPYQNGAGSTVFLNAGNNGDILTFGASSAPSWVAPSSITVGTATSATSATTAQRVSFQAVPSSSGDSCTTGQTAQDSTYFYVCVGTNSWKRILWDTIGW